ncbi:NADH:ubiquinone reductase (Na(+)-transporting) subunit B [Sinimarinibacterium sp. CAU 1509]|uniref:NADH:ubiquinone reductase (Na(+)-transporting) subunit B n=1 Tax=Sinimarinibacterium sp. CAU 1509 TaxID=2562283 RepID=UPI0010AB5843|nr:NADH:ubiquinone reductase (Na(+)-transporting) subunit B [Sinimarinibacterium sp. CAU 1509]TJY64756.1 NADH:ubiquinone reductase (Na(+)-transporting) subunit B [Sinimarinibacterium sp. CAU 1509]
MSAIRSFLDRVEPLFKKGGRFEKLYPLFEAVDTIAYSPGDVTRAAPHVRDAIDLKRVMIYVWLATFPAIAVGCWNVGFQANVAMAELGQTQIAGWRGALLHLFGIGVDPNSIMDCFWHGFWYWVPVYAVTFVVGGFWEVLFATVRRHEINEGFFVTSILFSLILPPTVPLWQVALGISFGTVIGKEIFGGTGKNFLNPALVGRAFLYFAYPAQQTGDTIWTAVDGFTSATTLGIAKLGGLEAVKDAGLTWMQTFVGVEQGSIGEVSALAIFIGGAFLLYTGVANYRIVIGMLAGMIAAALLFNVIGSDKNPMFAFPWYWHLTVGGFAFGTMFMATDPVSAAHTDTGRWIFGAFCGAMVVLVRVVNPAFPESVMLAILLSNIVAPLIDFGVIKANVARRQRRLAAA